MVGRSDGRATLGRDLFSRRGDLNAMIVGGGSTGKCEGGTRAAVDEMSMRASEAHYVVIAGFGSGDLQLALRRQIRKL